MVIGISGKAGSGKDTVFGFIEEALGDRVLNVKFSQALKDEASRILDIPVENWESQEFKATVIPTSTNGFTYRDFLLQLGTELMRSVDPNWWVRKGCEIFDDNRDKICIVTDMRFPNELMAVEAWDGITIRVNMPGNPGADHVSDKALDNEDFDYTITSEKGDLEGLKKQVAVILEKEGLIISSV